MRNLICAAAAWLLCLLSALACAQSAYPSKPIRCRPWTPRQVTEKMKSDTQEFARILKAAGVEAE
jgi:hypothetical protein